MILHIKYITTVIYKIILNTLYNNFNKTCDMTLVSDIKYINIRYHCPRF